MSYVISHLPLFPVIFTIPPNTQLSQNYPQKYIKMTVYRGLGPSGLCYLLPYFSVKHCPTLFSAVSLRAWKLSCSQVFQPLTLPRVCSEQKVWVQFSKVNLFFKYFNPIIWSFNINGWFILSLFKIRLVRTEKLKMYGTLFTSHKAIH